MPQITVNGHQLEWEEGMTLRRALDLMNYSWPLLVIRIDGVLIKKEDWNSTLINPGASISAFHLLSGG